MIYSSNQLTMDLNDLLMHARFIIEHEETIDRYFKQHEPIIIFYILYITQQIELYRKLHPDCPIAQNLQGTKTTFRRWEQF